MYTHPLRLMLDLFLWIPRTCIAEAAPSLARTLATKLLRQVLRRDLCEELILIAGTEDGDLRHRHRVKPGANDTPDGREAPRCVDDIELAHAFRVAVLTDRTGLVDVFFDPIEGPEADILEIEDCAGRLDRMSNRRTACGYAVRQELLVLVNELFKHPVLGGGLVQGINVKLPQLLDVHRPAVLRMMMSKRVISLANMRRTISVL